MDNYKEQVLGIALKIKDAVVNFVSSYIKAIILVLVLLIGLGGASVVMGKMEQKKIEAAPEVTVRLIEGQSYSFTNELASFEMATDFAEFVEVNIADQKIYALASYPDGKITFIGKLADGSYEKYTVLVTTLDTELMQIINIARNSTVTVRDWDAAYAAQWSSSDENVATVDQQGNVTGVNLGECVISAVVSKEVTVIYQVTVVDVALSPANAYVYVGDAINFELLGYTPAEDEKLSLTSDNEAVAAAKGMKARGLATGEANIFIELNGNTYTSKLSVLGNPSVENISLTVDTEAEVVAHNIPDFKDCEVTVENEDVAIFNNGKILGVSIGTTQATGTIKDHSFTFEITVTGATLVPDENAVYDTTFNKYNAYDGLKKYSVKENETLRIYFTNANSNIPAVKTQHNNFRIFDTTNEYIEIIGTNPGVGLLVVDFDDNRLYAEIHVQHTNSTITQRQWEVQLKNFTDILKANGDWTYSDDVQGAYVDAKSDIERKINGIAFINYAFQEMELFHLENYMTIGEDGKVSGEEETMQIVHKYMDIIEPTEEKPIELKSLQVGDIVVWKTGSVSVFMGINNGGTQTWYEVNEDLLEADGFFARFYCENNRNNDDVSQVLRLHYTL